MLPSRFDLPTVCIVVGHAKCYTILWMSRQIMTWSTGRYRPKHDSITDRCRHPPNVATSHVQIQKKTHIKRCWINGTLKFTCVPNSLVKCVKFRTTSPKSQITARKHYLCLAHTMKSNRSPSSPMHGNKLARNPANDQWMSHSKDTLPLLPYSREDPCGVTGIGKKMRRSSIHLLQHVEVRSQGSGRQNDRGWFFEYRYCISWFFCQLSFHQYPMFINITGLVHRTWYHIANRLSLAHSYYSSYYCCFDHHCIKQALYTLPFK